MEQGELLRRVVDTLERLHLTYLVTGSIATILYGEPRFTNDIDVVVQLPLDRAAALVDASLRTTSMSTLTRSGWRSPAGASSTSSIRPWG